MINPLNHYRDSTYNTDDAITGSSDDSGGSSTASYASASSTDPEANGGGSGENLQSVTDQVGDKNSLSYANTDSNNPGGGFQPTGSTDSAGRSNSYTYTSFGSLQDSSNSGTGSSAAKATVHYADAGSAKGVPVNSVDPANQGVADPGSPCGSGHSDCTKYDYDASGDLITVTPPNTTHGNTQLGAQHFTYDGFGRTKTVTNGQGVTSTNTYDLLSRTLSTSFSDGSPTITFTYSSGGSVLTRTRGSASTGYQYDALGRLTGENIAGTSVSCPSGASNSMLCYAYDAAGNLTGLSDGRGTDHYAYDAANQLVLLTEATGRSDVFAYDGNGHRTQEWLKATGQGTPAANGTVTVTDPTGWGTHIVDTLDKAGKPCEIKATASGGGTVADTTYKYNTGSSACTNPTATTSMGLMQIAHDYSAGTRTTYTYSDTSTDRLSEAKTTLDSDGSTASDYTYGYDVDGNLTSGSNGDHDYDEANQRFGTGIGYDADGNMTAGPATAGAQTNVYSGSDQTTNTTIGSVNQTNAYAATDQVERMSAGAMSFTAGRNGQVGQPSLQSDTNTSTGTIRYFVRDNGGALVAMVTASTSSPAVGSGNAADYYLTDASGNVSRLVNAVGTVTGFYGYDPYGGHMTATGADAGTNPFRFASAYLDPTGLYKMGARYYNPATGRFMSQDSVTHTGDLTQGNRYAYAGDNPTNALDPTGQDSWFDSITLSGCAALLVGVCGGVTYDSSDDSLSFSAGPVVGVGGDVTEFAGSSVSGEQVSAGACAPDEVGGQVSANSENEGAVSAGPCEGAGIFGGISYDLGSIDL